MSNEAGYTSAGVLLSLIFILVLATGVAGLLMTSRLPLDRLTEASKQKIAYVKAQKQFKELIEKDKTSNANSNFDPVWELHDLIIDDYKVKISPKNRNLNLNWINLNILENTKLLSFLKPGKTIEQLKSHRDKVGFHLDYNPVYQDFFEPKTIELLFTSSSYANINISYEECLEDLYRFCTNDSGDYRQFRNAIVNRLQSKTLWNEQELFTALGSAKAQVFPRINTLPHMNINYVPKEILEAVLDYPFPDGKLANATAFKDSLLLLREQREIKEEDLHTLLIFTNEQQKRIMEYLGVESEYEFRLIRSM